MSKERVYVADANLKQYGPLENLERGQVFELQNQRNDEKLLGRNAMGHHYVLPVESDQEIYTCVCGKEFVDGVTSTYAQNHLRKWRHDTNPIDMDGPQLKGAGPKHIGGVGDPDRAGGEGWDLEVNGPQDAGLSEVQQDPYAGERQGSMERPKRLSLG